MTMHGGHDSPLSVRRTEPGDLDPVVAMEAAAEAARWLGDIGRGWHERALADPAQEHLVARAHGAVVGFVVLARLTDTTSVIEPTVVDPTVVELRRIVVSGAHRGAGFGRALFRAAVVRARDHHQARRIWLDVKVGNTRARSLYESEGFVAEQTLPAAPGPDGNPTGLVIMALDLQVSENRMTSPPVVDGQPIVLDSPTGSRL